MKSTIHEFQKNNLQGLSKNLKKSIAFFLVAIIGISCSKGDDPTLTSIIPTSTNQFRIKEVRDANNVLLKSYSYNSQNQETNLTQGDNTIRTFYNNVSGKKIKTIETIANQSTDIVIEFNYNANNELEEVIKKNGATPYQKNTYTYLNGNINTSKKYITQAQGFWLLDNESNYTYNSNNQNTEITVTNNSKTTFDYDLNGNLILETYYIATTNTVGIPVVTFKLSSKKIYTYDNTKPVYYPNSTLSKNNITEFVYKTYNTTTGALINSTTQIFTYDYNLEGNISKSYLNGVLQFNYILEKIN